MFAELFGHSGCSEQEDAAVPVMPTALAKDRRRSRIGLLDEALDALNVVGAIEGTCLDVAILSVGLARTNAERHDPAVRRARNGEVDGVDEGSLVHDHVIGG